MKTKRQSCGLITMFAALALSSASAQSPVLFPQAEAATTGSACLVSEEMRGTHLYHIGQEVIKAPADKIFAEITDYSDAGKLFSNLKSCKVLRQEANTKIVSFSLRGVANLWNFDYTLAIKESPGLIEWHRVGGAFKANEGYWKLEPMANGSTLVTCAKYVDGGMIPQAIVGREVNRSMAEVMGNLKRISEKG
jgi:uncharacterized membrane protein